MRKSIMSAVFTLTLFTVLDRALGFGFKIYLSRELGAASLGLYQVALSFFFAFSLAGKTIPCRHFAYDERYSGSSRGEKHEKE